MARKKKTETIKLAETKPITYTGQVTIKKIKKGKVVSTEVFHNEGTKQLFKFLLNCLAGNWIPSARPSWVTTGQTDSTTGTTKYVSDSLVDISQPPQVYENGDEVYVEYRFLLNHKPQYATKGFNCLILYNTDNKPTRVDDGADIDANYSMIVNFDTQHQSTDEQMLIIWQLEVKN